MSNMEEEGLDTLYEKTKKRLVVLEEHINDLEAMLNELEKTAQEVSMSMGDITKNSL